MGRHVSRRLGRGTIVLLIVLGLLLAAGGGSAFAAYRYDQSRVDRILPGITIDGVPVGDMTRAEATAAVKPVIDGQLGKIVFVTGGGKIWMPTLGDLGLSAVLDTAVNEALALTDDYSWMSRAYHRLANKPIIHAIGVSFSMDDHAVDTFVATAAKGLARPARDASFNLVSGRPVAVHAEIGQALASSPSGQMLKDAVAARQTWVELPIRAVAPKISDAQVGKTLVVDVSKNMLYLYEGFKVIRSYPVATAKAGFLTPDGAWTVNGKVENPTWHNPAPNGWGAGEPLVIPPGPGNPLGTRALYLSAPGIRIHGTPSDSSIGTYASHGCIRMHISDSEALYPLVPIGTPVFIIGAPPWGLTAHPGAAG
jgi:lipoprotein-anchoring transpeptidase ErfK/SrfK